MLDVDSQGRDQIGPLFVGRAFVLPVGGKKDEVSSFADFSFNF